MCIGFCFGRWCWNGSESLGLGLDWFLWPQGCYWIGLGGVHLGLVLDWFWAGICSKTLINKAFCSLPNFTVCATSKTNFWWGFLGRILSGTKLLDWFLLLLAHGNYWIGFVEQRIGFGLVWGGALLDWIHFEWNATGLAWFRCAIGLDTLSGKQPCSRSPSRPKSARAASTLDMDQSTKSLKWKKNTWIEALKATNRLELQEIVHPNRPSIRQFDYSGADNNYWW